MIPKAKLYHICRLSWVLMPKASDPGTSKVPYGGACILVAERPRGKEELERRPSLTGDLRAYWRGGGEGILNPTIMEPNTTSLPTVGGGIGLYETKM